MTKKCLITVLSSVLLASVLLALYGCNGDRPTSAPPTNTPTEVLGQSTLQTEDKTKGPSREMPTPQATCVPDKEIHDSSLTDTVTARGGEAFFPGTVLYYAREDSSRHTVNYIFVLDISKSFLGDEKREIGSRLGCSAQAVHDRTELVFSLLKLAALYQKDLVKSKHPGSIRIVWIDGGEKAKLFGRENKNYPYLSMDELIGLKEARDYLEGPAHTSPGLRSFEEVFKWVEDMSSASEITESSGANRRPSEDSDWFVFLFTDGWMLATKEGDTLEGLAGILKEIQRLSDSSMSSEVRIYPFLFVDCAPPEMKSKVKVKENGEEKLVEKWESEKWKMTIDFWTRWNQYLPNSKAFFVGLPQQEWRKKFEELNPSASGVKEYKPVSWREAFRDVVKTGAFPGIDILSLPQRKTGSPDTGVGLGYSPFRILIEKGYEVGLYVFTNMPVKVEKIGYATIHRDAEMPSSGEEQVKVSNPDSEGWYNYYAQPARYFSACTRPYWQWKWSLDSISEIEGNLWVFLLEAKDKKIEWGRQAKDAVSDMRWTKGEITWHPDSSLEVQWPNRVAQLLGPYKYCKWYLRYSTNNSKSTSVLKEPVPIDISEGQAEIPMGWTEFRNSLPLGNGKIELCLDVDRKDVQEDEKGKDLCTHPFRIKRECTDTVDWNKVDVGGDVEGGNLIVDLAKAVKQNEVPASAVFTVTMTVSFKNVSSVFSRGGVTVLGNGTGHRTCSATVTVKDTKEDDLVKSHSAQVNQVNKGSLEFSYSGSRPVGRFIWKLNDEECAPYISALSLSIKWGYGTLKCSVSKSYPLGERGGRWVVQGSQER